MKLSRKHKKERCPKCGSNEVLTLGLDQMCCTCDWDNSLLLVQLGQMDHPLIAARDHFSGKAFEDLAPDPAEISEPSSSEESPNQFEMTA